MARGINKVILVGNLGADPESRFSTAGAQVTTIRIATSDSWRDKQTGEQQERTEWHRVKFFGRLAEIAAALKPAGRLLVSEPSFHVSAQDFEKTIALAKQAGLRVIATPRIRGGQSVMLEK